MTGNWSRKRGTSYFGNVLFLILFGACLGLSGSADAQERPRNVTSDRYVVNQTFDGQAFFKDNNVWVYTPAFADTFGMPAEGTDPDLKGIEAAAFRVEQRAYQMCGLGGKAENCKPNVRCVTDIYVDESKHPLPWATDQRSDWLGDYNSSMWLRTSTERIVSPKTPEGVTPAPAIQGTFTLHPFADLESRLEAVIYQNAYVPYEGDQGFGNGTIIFGFKRNAIAGLTMINLGYRCMPRNSTRKSISFRLETREKKDSMKPSRQFYEFELPDKFERKIDERKRESDEQAAAFYRNLLENMKRSKP